MIYTRRATLAMLAATAAMTSPAFAAKSPVFSKNGIAINGYDPVAYFTQSKPVKGSKSHKASYNGATFLFASAENKAKFEGNTAKYAPQYGGYCAYAVSKGATAKTDPNAWTVYNGKLYLNYNLDVRSIWKGDIPGNVKRANANWPTVLNK
ncbi:YHS domain-containing protein [Amylibacter sp. SFDW26]|uniref:YHS domain-containing (seleno)protein n=1 Tax=Amylibacter sp. SFDW26 TaxID=2652722 RepID=UPI0012626BFD|nr:YHS domain-containing (seleno)protein [Amylibacter sp. SFDW26]KAB7615434.1 YHS domain-containing protein [Amylibacter sp. SFDW26]